MVAIMTKGRARIPMAINTTPRVGDIHKYSANAINRIGISTEEKENQIQNLIYEIVR